MSTLYAHPWQSGNLWITAIRGAKLYLSGKSPAAVCRSKSGPPPIGSESTAILYEDSPCNCGHSVSARCVLILPTRS